MASVIVKETVLRKLDDLVDSLFDSKYFAVRDNALAYVHSISDFIQSIPTQRYRSTKIINMVPDMRNIHPTAEPPGL